MEKKYTINDLKSLAKFLWNNRNNQDFMWEYFLDEWLKEYKKRNKLSK